MAEYKGSEKLIFAPSYYADFKCACGDCTHSCCVAWEIGIDKKTYKKYKRLKGEVGKRIKESIDERAPMRFALREDGRCPHLNGEGLCDIIISLGEGYLCDICREHPRFYNFFYQGKEKRCEVGLGLACEAAARLALFGDGYASVVPIDTSVAFKASYHRPRGVDILAERQRIYDRLSSREGSAIEEIKRISESYGVSFERFSKEEFFNAYSSLEYLNAANKDRFISSASVCVEHSEKEDLLVERFFAYLVFRYLPTSADGREISLNVAFCAMLASLYSSLIAKCESQDEVIRTAVTVCEEIEYDPENVEQIKFYLDIYGREKE